MTVPTDVLWQEHGPIFPRTWSDYLDDERLHHLDGVGHFTPVEAPSTFAQWINHATATLPEVEGKAQRSSRGASKMNPIILDSNQSMR